MERLRTFILWASVAIAGMIILGAINPHLAIDAGPGAFDESGADWRHIVKILSVAGGFVGFGLLFSYAVRRHTKRDAE